MSTRPPDYTVTLTAIFIVIVALTVIVDRAAVHIAKAIKATAACKETP